jgi:hypothetical protein
VRVFGNGSGRLASPLGSTLRGPARGREGQRAPGEACSAGANHLAVRRAPTGAGDCQADRHQPADGVALGSVAKTIAEDGRTG